MALRSSLHCECAEQHKREEGAKAVCVYAHTYFTADISEDANSLFGGIWKFRSYPFTFGFDVGH